MHTSTSPLYALIASNEIAAAMMDVDVAAGGAGGAHRLGVVEVPDAGAEAEVLVVAKKGGGYAVNKELVGQPK